MVYAGWLSFGGNEIVNTPRALALSRELQCAPGWFKPDGCETLADALDQDFTDPTTAPWYDPSYPEVSERFFGLRGIDILQMHDAAREAQVTEGLRDGVNLGRIRRGGKEIRVRAYALAKGLDALEHGMSWLDAALSPGACGQHGEGCGGTDAEFFVECPSAWLLVEEDDGDGGTIPVPVPREEYDDLLIEERRFLHEAAVVSGPLIVEEDEHAGIHGRLVEFTILSERPYLFGATRSRSLPTAGGTTVVQDTPYNLIKYPSAEITGSTPLERVRVNYVMNPSLENNTADWSAGASAVSGASPGPYYSGTRVSDISAHGSYAYRARLAPDTSGTSANGVAVLRARYTAPLDVSIPSGALLTASAWVALQRASDSSYSTPTKLEMIFQWLDENDLPLGPERSIEIPSSDYSGSVPMIEIDGSPSNAEGFEVRFEATVPWRKTVGNASQTADIRLFVDALAVVA